MPNAALKELETGKAIDLGQRICLRKGIYDRPLKRLLYLCSFSTIEYIAHCIVPTGMAPTLIKGAQWQNFRTAILYFCETTTHKFLLDTF